MALPMMGGADAQMRPEEYFPPAPRGGLGGLGGLAPSTNDALRATFMSMMSSPSNNWLQNMPQIYAGLRDERRYAEKEQRAQAAADQEREALKAALVAGGISPGEAEMLSVNPGAARLRLEQVASERAAQQEQSFIQGVFSGSDNLSDAPRVGDIGDSWAPHRQEFGWAEPGQGEPDTPVEPTQAYAGPTQVAQAGPQPVTDAYTPPQFQITNPEAQRLMKNREQLVRYHMQAPSDRTRKIIENNISHIDKQLEQLSPTSSQKEYNFDQQQRIAMGLPVQTFSDWDATQAERRRPTTNVDARNMGSVPQGYRVIYDDNGNPVQMEPIPGGPADTSSSDANAADGRIASTDIITSAARRAREALQSDGAPATGTVGRLMARLPESNAAEVRRQVEVLKATARIENLQAMRAASPTGGALGNVTDSEGAMLAAKSGALDPDSPTFERDLDDYERTLLRIVHGTNLGDAIFEETRQQKAVSPRPRARNPQTGEMIEHDGTQWVPVQEGN